MMEDKMSLAVDKYGKVISINDGITFQGYDIFHNRIRTMRGEVVEILSEHYVKVAGDDSRYHDVRVSECWIHFKCDGGSDER
jgi:hypothetical protein